MTVPRKELEPGDFLAHVTPSGLANVFDGILLGHKRPMAEAEIVKVAVGILTVSLELVVRQALAIMATKGRLLIHADGGASLRESNVRESSRPTKTETVKAPKVQRHSKPLPTIGGDVDQEYLDLLQRARNMYEAGRSIHQIGEKVEFAPATVYKWAIKYGWQKPTEPTRQQCAAPGCGKWSAKKYCVRHRRELTAVQVSGLERLGEARDAPPSSSPSPSLQRCFRCKVPTSGPHCHSCGWPVERKVVA